MKALTPAPSRLWGSGTRITVKLLGLFAVFMYLTGMATHTSDSVRFPSSLAALPLEGRFDFDNLSGSEAATDFGNRFRQPPAAVLHPKSSADIAAAVSHAYQLGLAINNRVTTFAARGHGHSLQGQALAPGGVVVHMESLRRPPKVRNYDGDVGPFIDVSGGELWINVLRASLEHGLAPRSWTDYLRLTVGGTLSNAGISGQAFRHGPQISNVHRLQVVTGKGELVSCSPEKNSDLFYAVLGGLGQFGIITSARIALEPAPNMVRWIRVLYSDFAAFTQDQEMLISAERCPSCFDYIEGFVLINRTGILNNWRSSFKPQDPVQAGLFSSDGRTLYCLEMTKIVRQRRRRHPHGDDDDDMEEVEGLLSRLQYIESTLFQTVVPYAEFLDRVHASETKLRAKGLWDVPHPWLNLLVPRSSIHGFARGVFGSIVRDSNNGPILLYPLHKSKWDNRTSAVIPGGGEEEVFYLVAFLASASHNNLEEALELNRKILEFCDRDEVRMKQYLPHYTTEEEWRAHYGPAAWEVFVRRKSDYDPLALLAPGQRIFAGPLPSSAASS